MFVTSFIRPDLSGKKKIFMLLYSHLIISREQHDWQIPSLAKRAHQTLDKTGIFNPNHRVPCKNLIPSNLL